MKNMAKQQKQIAKQAQQHGCNRCASNVNCRCPAQDNVIFVQPAKVNLDHSIVDHLTFLHFTDDRWSLSTWRMCFNFCYTRNIFSFIFFIFFQQNVRIGSPVQNVRVASPIQTVRVASPVQTVRVASPVQTVRVASPVQTVRVASPVQMVAPAAPSTQHCSGCPQNAEGVPASKPKISKKPKVGSDVKCQS